MERYDSVQEILKSMDFTGEETELFMDSIKLTKLSQRVSSINVTAEMRRRIREMIENEIQKDSI